MRGQGNDFKYSNLTFFLSIKKWRSNSALEKRGGTAVFAEKMLEAMRGGDFSERGSERARLKKNIRLKWKK